jgi:acyl carrier protein
MAETTTQRVIQVIARRLNIAPQLITLDTSLDSMNISSLRCLNVIFGIEKEFLIDIPTEQAVLLRTVRQIVEVVENPPPIDPLRAELLGLVKS